MIPADGHNLARLTALEESFEYQVEATEACAWFDIVRGKVPVLVSAPHACRHNRGGVEKMQEEYTGALAIYLARVCDCYAIVTRYKTREDPNWDTYSDYKNAIGRLQSEIGFRFIVDLHGMTNRYHMGVALGTIKENSCSADTVLPHFIDAGFQLTKEHELTPDAKTAWRRVVVDHPKFTGGVVNHTVTRYGSVELGVPSVQIELSSQVRVVESAATDDWPLEYRGNQVAIAATMKALRSLVVSFA